MHLNSLDNAQRGAVLERFMSALGEVLANIQDPNTPAKAKRKVVITLTLSPDETRQAIKESFAIKSVLEPYEEITGLAFAGVDRKTGELAISESDPLQRTMFGEEDDDLEPLPNVTPIGEGR